MEPILRPDLTRIVLTGSESTGKTTLAAQLAGHYGVEYVPEFVRDYAQSRGGVLSFSDHGPIAHGQMALENEYAERAGKLLFLDADLLSTVAYCQHYFGACPPWIEETAIARRPALYLLTAIDVPWVADGVRDRGKRRDEMHALFVDTLKRLKAPYTVITGLGDDRLKKAIGAVDRLLAERRA